MKIAVVLPPPVTTPRGGYKIIYQYCDLLISRNPTIEIEIYYDIAMADRPHNQVYNYMKKLYYTYIKKRFYLWFDFENENKIKHIIGINRLKNNNILYDIILVTSIETAQFIKELALKQPILYFIQGFEVWSRSEKEVYESYNYGFINIVVSQWLKEKVTYSKAKVALKLSNPIDNSFSITKPLESRSLKSILFMYHEAKMKGSTEAIKACVMLQEQDPTIKFSCFSAFPKPSKFPEWIDFYHLPSRKKLNALLNENFIFLSTSYTEGYGLPAAEAMGCGCCVVTTDNGGVNDFAINNETAFMISLPPKPQTIVNKINDIFTDSTKALVVAKRGYDTIQNITWTNNITELEKLLLRCTKIQNRE